MLYLVVPVISARKGLAPSSFTTCLAYPDRAGEINHAGAVYPGLTLRQMSYRVSDHFPLWVEFIIDRSSEVMARTLGVDPAMPDPLGTVPD